MQRRTVACRREIERGNWALFASETGTSRESPVPGSILRRMASKTPPPDTLSAVANSSDSCPEPFLPRTKKAIEIGKRSDSRRSGIEAGGRTILSLRLILVSSQILRGDLTWFLLSLLEWRERAKFNALGAERGDTVFCSRRVPTSIDQKWLRRSAPGQPPCSRTRKAARPWHGSSNRWSPA